MTRPDDVRWFDALGKCRECPKPATGKLMGSRNDSYGPYCQSCAEKRLRIERTAADIMLLPCPFCGGPACFQDNESKTWNASKWWIQCEKCHARGSKQVEQVDVAGALSCRTAAIMAWNRRLP